MKQNNKETVLEKIGISNKIVKEWKRKGLKITYPVRARAHFFKSEDGEVFIENGDKFVPPLTKKETSIYKKNPEKFREDILKNARFYIKFCDFIFSYQKHLQNLKAKEKITALLSLLYLFQRAMDYHHYHWDRYLVYQNYPSTPVGYWWKKLKDLYTKATGEKVLKNKPTLGFLNLLTENKEILGKIKNNLSEKDFLKLKSALTAIKIFEDAQQRDGEIIIDFKTKENIFIRTAFPMWTGLYKEIKKHPELTKKRDKIKKILNLHPIIAIRKIMLLKVLGYFDEEVFLQFEKEIKRWT